MFSPFKNPQFKITVLLCLLCSLLGSVASVFLTTRYMPPRTVMINLPELVTRLSHQVASKEMQDDETEEEARKLSTMIKDKLPEIAKKHRVIIVISQNLVGAQDWTDVVEQALKGKI